MSEDSRFGVVKYVVVIEHGGCESYRGNQLIDRAHMFYEEPHLRNFLKTIRGAKPRVFEVTKELELKPVIKTIQQPAGYAIED